jgi:phosphatidylglycerophosphatase A
MSQELRLATAIATLFGVGRVKTAPGTVASIVALPLAWLIQIIGGEFLLIAMIILIYALGVWACGLYEKETGTHDPSECVVDEVVGQWIACALAPVSLLGYGLAFLFFRVFDITKIWPISEAERLPSGTGIMFDDVVAGFMAGVLIAIIGYAGLV